MQTTPTGYPIPAAIAAYIRTTPEGCWHWLRADGRPRIRKSSLMMPGWSFTTTARQAWRAARGTYPIAPIPVCALSAACVNPHTAHRTPGPVQGSTLERMPVRARAIVRATAAAYHLDAERLLERNRCAPLPEARHVAMALLEQSGYTPAAIARFMLRDHSTVLHGIARATAAYSDVVARVRVEYAHIMRGGPLDEGEARARIVSWCAGQERTTRRAVTAYVDQAILGSRRPCVEAPSGLYVLATRADVRGGLLAELALAGWDGHADRLWLHIQRSGWAVAS